MNKEQTLKKLEKIASDLAIDFPDHQIFLFLYSQKKDEPSYHHLFGCMACLRDALAWFFSLLISKELHHNGKVH